MDEAVVTLLRRTLDVTADEIDERDLPEAWTPGGGSERSPRWRALTLVASAALMAAGVVVVASRGGDPTETGRGTDTVVPAQQPDWYLPSFLPEGYDLTGLGSWTETLDEPSSSQTWVRKEDGITTGNITAIVNPLLPRLPVEGTESTVHGFPAVVTSSGLADALNADNVTLHVEWSEHDSRFAIDTTGIGPGATVELANSSTVVGDTISLDLASIPDRFELVDTSESRAGDTFPMVTLVAAPRELDHSGAIFTNLVNGAGSLDAVVGRESERRVVDGVEYSILVESPGTANERTTIEWLRDGHTFSTFGRIEVDTLLDFAAGLTPATPDEVERAKLATADLALAIPEYASATLSTGDDVSVRAAEGSNRARALCLTDATPECFRLYFDFNDSVTVSGFYRVFNDSGKRRIVGWHASAPGTITASNDAPVEIVQGSEGWFVTFAVADGAPLPVLDYENGTGYISENDWP